MNKKHVFMGGHHNSGTSITRELILRKGYKAVDEFADYGGKGFHSFVDAWFKSKDAFEHLKNKIRSDTSHLDKWVIKHGYMMLMIPELKKAFPDSVFVMCVRHPLDQLRKPQHNYERFGNSNSHDPPLVEKFDLYSEWVDEGLKHADHILRLEDLLFDTKNTIESLYKFLECDSTVSDDILQMILPPSKTILDGHRPPKVSDSDPLSLLKVSEFELDNHFVDTPPVSLRDDLQMRCRRLGYNVPEYLKIK